MKTDIKLIALDIDGVVSKGMKSCFNYTILNILANINIKAKKKQYLSPGNSYYRPSAALYRSSSAGY